jgi:hypothetical protein
VAEQDETLTDIYDRVRTVRRRRSVVVVLAALLAVALTACGGGPAAAPVAAAPAPAVEPVVTVVPVHVCGTTARPPVRVHDGACFVPSHGVKWYEADPACLDADDFTAVGQVLDDDYREPCQKAKKTSKPKPTPTKKPQPTAASRG